jgi:hypothetical protein
VERRVGQRPQNEQVQGALQAIVRAHAPIVVGRRQQVKPAYIEP